MSLRLHRWRSVAIISLWDKRGLSQQKIPRYLPSVCIVLHNPVALHAACPSFDVSTPSLSSFWWATMTLVLPGD